MTLVPIHVLSQTHYIFLKYVVSILHHFLILYYFHKTKSQPNAACKNNFSLFNCFLETYNFRYNDLGVFFQLYFITGGRGAGYNIINIFQLKSS